MTSPSRRPVRRLLSLLVPLAVVATACGSDGDGGADSTDGAVVTDAPSDSGPPAESTPDEPASTDGPPGAFPVTVETIFGDVTIEEQPTRVVALGWADAETALALGVEPVGATDWIAFGGDGIGPWSTPYTTSPEILPTTPNYEAIAALEPDLILNTRADGDEAVNALLSEIAPVVAIPAGDPAWGTPWDHQVEIVAAALGKPAEGEALIESVNTAFAGAAESHPEFDGKSVSVAAFFSGQWGAYMSKDLRVQFMEQLGFVNSEAVEALDTGSFYVELSPESLDVLDADLTVAFPFVIADVATIHADPLFNAVPSVAAGNAVVLDDEDLTAAFSDGSASALLFAIERAVPLFAAAVAR